MKLNFRFLREEIVTYYKKEFYFWVFSVFFLGISVFFFIREFKMFLTLNESHKKIEESYYRIQPEIVRLKEALSKVNWQREFQKKELEVSLEVDLTNLKKTFTTLRTLTNSQEDTFFHLIEMTFEKRENTKPLLKIKGTKIIYK
ncbi:MAG: hypothetical protein ABWJ99_05430 [Caldimicrobium sp.]